MDGNLDLQVAYSRRTWSPVVERYLYRATAIEHQPDKEQGRSRSLTTIASFTWMTFHYQLRGCHSLLPS